MRHIILALALILFFSNAFAQSEITVSANADVSARPDVAEFQLSIVVRQMQATDAFRIYLARYDALQRAMKSLPDSINLMTGNLSITPSFNYKKPEETTPDYYQVSAYMSLSVPVADLNAVLGKVASVEGITINDISFHPKDNDKMEVKALEEAEKKAHEKAKALANLEGLTELKVKSMNTSVTRPIYPMMKMTAMEMAQPSVTPSDVSVSASITVTYTAVAR